MYVHMCIIYDVYGNAGIRRSEDSFQRVMSSVLCKAGSLLFLLLCCVLGLSGLRDSPASASHLTVGMLVFQILQHLAFCTTPGDPNWVNAWD